MVVVNKGLRNLDGTMVFFFFILALDVLIFLLSINNYYFSFIKPTNNILPILLTLVAFYALASVHKIKRFWVICVTITGFLILGIFSITNNFYDTIESPTGNEKLTIEHRNATLGETNHFYNFYLHTSIPGLMKKLNDDTIRIVTRGVNADDLGVLGVDNAVWINDEKVIFHSIEVDLKY